MAPAVAPIRDRSTFRALRQPDGRAQRGPVRVSYVGGTGHAPGPARVGYAIGRTCGNAVQRNRLRRRCRAAVRLCAADLVPGAYLVRPDAAAAVLPYRALAGLVAGAMAAAPPVAGRRPAPPSGGPGR